MTFAAAVSVDDKTSPAWLRVARVGLSALGLAVLLASCGGGDQVKKFKPAKLLSFGDESSALVESDDLGGGAKVKGLKYTVNSMTWLDSVTVTNPQIPDGAVITTPFTNIYPSEPTLAISVDADTSSVVTRTFDNMTVKYILGTAPETTITPDVTYEYFYDCGKNALWIQVLAERYSLGYGQQCPVGGKSGAYTYATPGAKVDDVVAQVQAHKGELNSQTMVTVMAGQNDILQAYSEVQAVTLSRDSAKARMTERGRRLARLINEDIITTGARAVIVTLPSLGLTPYARAGQDAGLLGELTVAFNQGLVGAGGVVNDGHKIVQVRFYDQVRLISDAINDGRTYDGFSNQTDALCQSAGSVRPDGVTVASSTAPFFGGDALKYCTNYTLNSGGSIGTYLWADPINLSPGAHSRLGQLAAERADNNPL